MTCCALSLVALVAGLRCSTIEPGGNPQIAQVVYDEDFFYCQVLPKVLIAKSCSMGDPSLDSSGGCHSIATQFRVLPLESDAGVACDGDKRTEEPSAAARTNYIAAQGEMTQNSDTAPLLTRPTKKIYHPRLMFEETSPEADIIRQWALRSSR